jgi:hypothetical protein
MKFGEAGHAIRVAKAMVHLWELRGATLELLEQGAEVNENLFKLWGQNKNFYEVFEIGF